MKKTLWMLGMAVTALTSCTQNEVLEVAESRVIGFETFVGKNTRAAVPINQAQASIGTPAMDNLFQFWVYAWQDNNLLFNGTDENAKVYYSNELRTFTYDNHQMWDLGSTYSFAAYSNGNTPLVSPLSDPPQNTEVNTSPVNVNYEKIMNSGQVVGSQLTFTDYTVGDYDLLAAIAPTKTLPLIATSVSDVPFNFQHLLSLVNINLYNNTEEEYLLIDDIVFEGIRTATCTYSINGDNRSIEWATTGTPGNYTFNGTDLKMAAWEDDNTDHNDATDPNVKKKYLGPGQTLTMSYFVIPQNNQTFTNIEVNMQAYKIEGNKFVQATNDHVTKYMTLAVGVNDHSSWVPGFIYNYRGDLDGAADYIHFHVNSVEDWSDKSVEVNPSGSNIYN